MENKNNKLELLKREIEMKNINVIIIKVRYLRSDKEKAFCEQPSVHFRTRLRAKVLLTPYQRTIARF